MIGVTRSLALAAALVALCAARPGPSPQELEQSEGVDPLEVQGLLEEFRAIGERELERRRRAAPEAAFEPLGLDANAVQGLIDEFKAIGEREQERRRRAAPVQEEEAGAVKGLLDQFKGRSRRAAPAPAPADDVYSSLFAPEGIHIRTRREVEPQIMESLKAFLGDSADEEE